MVYSEHPDGDSHTDADHYADEYTDIDANRHSYADANDHSDSDANEHADGNSNNDADRDCNDNSDRYGNANKYPSEHEILEPDIRQQLEHSSELAADWGAG